MDLERVTRVPRLPRRRRDSHKGDFGTVLVVGGSRGMAGAAALSGAAALRSGAGLVRVACPAEVQPTVASFEPSYMTYPLACGPLGTLDDFDNRDTLSSLMEAADVLAIGPGIGRASEVMALVAWLLAFFEGPIVLDADGLAAVAGKPQLFREHRHPLVLTPHPGEFARVVNRPVAEIQADRESAALALAEVSPNVVVVLKGAGTVVAETGRLYVNTTGNPGMATGGTGDVLTGVLAALLAQGLDAFDAAVLGTFAHGLAGDIARDQNGEVGMIAGDLVDALPDVWVHLAEPAADGDD
jgi:NAD(P)H-hydrate epimerase